MISLLKDPLVKIGAFIIMYIILSGLWGEHIKAWGIYMAFLAFMLIVSMIIPESIDISSDAERYENYLSLFRSHSWYHLITGFPFSHSTGNHI